MRILYTGTLPPHPGGTAIVGAQLLRGLAARGHEVAAVAPITAAALAAGNGFGADDPRLQLYRFLVPVFDIMPELARPEDLQREQAQLAAILPRACERLRPELILIGRESAAWHLPLVPAPASTARAIIVHGGSTQQALVTGTDERAQRLRVLTGSADLLIAVAAHIARGLESIGLTRTTVIPNPVDMRLFYPRPPSDRLRKRLGLDDGHLVGVHVSNLKPVKRPLDIVELATEVDDPRIVYVIVGDGPLRGEMERRCRERNILARFRFPGWVPHDRVAEFLALADMVIMPSESEGQALAHLETQACGRLLIASDTPAAREVVDDEKTGLLFTMGSIADLVVTTRRAAGDPALRAALGRAACLAVRSHALDLTVARYEAALARLVGAPHDPAPAIAS